MDMATKDGIRARDLRRKWRAAWLEDSNINNNTRRLLKVIFDHLNNLNVCWPSQQRLADLAQVSKRTIVNHLRKAKACGWLTWANRSDERGQSSNMYRLAWPSFFDSGEGKTCVGGTQNLHTEPLPREPEKKSKPVAAHRTMTGAAALKEEGERQSPARPSQALPPHLHLFSRLWVELVGEKVKKPNLARLDTYSPAEIWTALSVLPARLRTGTVRVPASVFLRILEGTHLGERDPQHFTPDQLRRCFAGCLPEHVRGVRKQPSPEVPNDSTTTKTPSPAQLQSLRDETAQHAEEASQARAIVQGSTPEQWQTTCKALLHAITSGLFHQLAAVDAIVDAWGWSHRQADRALRTAGGAA